jgi:hypothetical protein
MDCLGNYKSMQGQCESCPLALLCIDTAIQIDGLIDAEAERRQDIAIMETDSAWSEETLYQSRL